MHIQCVAGPTGRYGRRAQDIQLQKIPYLRNWIGIYGLAQPLFTSITMALFLLAGVAIGISVPVHWVIWVAISLIPHLRSLALAILLRWNAALQISMRKCGTPFII